jgi:hypothetical protein
LAKPPAGAPWAPAPYDNRIVGAMQAIASGRDVPGYLAKIALDWIIDTACGTYDMSYRPQSDRDTAFAEGKRHVGNQIIKMIKLNPVAMKETDGRSSRTDRDPGRDTDAERKPE